MTRIMNVSRRHLIKSAVVGGLALSAEVSGFSLMRAFAGEKSLTPNLYVVIDPDGSVHITAHRSEMGQGTKTGLPQVVADELGADWSQVRIIQAIGDSRLGDQNTDGSRSVRRFYEKMREMGAAARQMMERAAAREWGVPVEEVHADNHRILHKKSGKTMPFGKAAVLAADDAVPGREELNFKSPADFTLIGKPVKIYDLDDMVSGRAIYAQDLHREGMLVAVIQRPPVFGATVKQYDAAQALKIAGVEKVIRMPDVQTPTAFTPLGGVAVLAKNTWSAMKGREALEIEWSSSPHDRHDSAAYQQELMKTAQKAGSFVGRHDGDVDQALAKSDKVVEADYLMPYYAHAPMEPPAALAHVTGETAEIWACVQDPQSTQDVVAATLGLKKENVTVHVTLLGGAFGRKSKSDFVAEAAFLSQQTGKPVKVVWTREDDIRHDYYHAISAQHLKAGLDKNGAVIAWNHNSVFPTIGSIFSPGADQPLPFEMGLGLVDLPYNIPNIRAEVGKTQAHIRIGWVRSVCNIHHAFAVGSFMDELAHAAGRDPRDFLLEHLTPDREIPVDSFNAKFNYGEKQTDYPFETARLKHVVRLVTDKAGWGRKLPKGHGLGLACHYSFLSHIAVVAEVAVKDGAVTIPRVDLAIDCGRYINPDRVIAQMEGSIIFSISHALTSELSIKGGKVEQSNFHDYRLARCDMTPDIRVHLVDSDDKPRGVGEPGVPPVTAAICNGIFAATGKRIRKLPIAEPF
ncbi:xanthine dehydrogenase family protein molybdopterin-binding subunit [Luteithermobacter gelatinilyticus]|uniref:xanthine dehydrogenase family protein molybdopterin-binding subunit n=1 Tax=Luteithermobacter gelatinilyticus TaxID=2582913 RepID=UPI00110699DA|nr:molybdopterin cofactor-binding domain-containing protein [Luteithermobacter gelatinilyticus]|tara:strand:+ start:17911 stop:20139 length:2229 start_codon:yes stop_codon:yes gene_type:complete